MELQTIRDKGRTIFQTAGGEGWIVCVETTVRWQRARPLRTGPHVCVKDCACARHAAPNTEQMLHVCVLSTFNELETLVFHPHNDGFLDTEKMGLLGIFVREQLAGKTPASYFSSPGDLGLLWVHFPLLQNGAMLHSGSITSFSCVLSTGQVPLLLPRTGPGDTPCN